MRLEYHYSRGPTTYYHYVSILLKDKRLATALLLKDTPAWWKLSRRRIDYLVKQILYNSKLVPNRTWIPKPNSTELRPLTVPPLPLRVRLKLIALTMRPIFATIPTSQHGYRPKYNRITAWEHLLGKWDKYKYIHEYDIRKFYDSIHTEPLIGKLSSLGIPPNIIKQITNTKYTENGETKNQETGILQGYPTSPLLALITLHLIESVQIHNISHFIGYADDGLLLTNDNTYQIPNPDIPALLKPILLRIPVLTRIAIRTIAWTLEQLNRPQTASLIRTYIPVPTVLHTLAKRLATVHLTLKPSATKTVKTPHLTHPLTFLGLKRTPDAELQVKSRSGLHDGAVLKRPKDVQHLYDTPQVSKAPPKPRTHQLMRALRPMPSVRYCRKHYLLTLALLKTKP
jgi:hypothetical protein